MVELGDEERVENIWFYWGFVFVGFWKRKEFLEDG
jgi:hypothetical protein